MEGIDRILANLRLGGEIRSDIDRRVGDADQPVMSRHLQKEQVTHPFVRHPQPGLRIEKNEHENVGVQIALHHDVGLAVAHQLDRQSRRVGIRATVVQARPAQIQSSRCCQGLDVRTGANQVRFGQPVFHGPAHGRQHDLLRGIGHSDPNRSIHARAVNKRGKCLGFLTT